MPNETTAFASSHRQKKTWLTVLAVLAVLVVFATVAALTMPASAMTAPATPETAATGETAAPESTALPQDNAAPSDTAQSNTVTEQAEAETAALPTAAQVPEGYTVQRTVRDEANGFAVTVYAPEGVIPEGAALSATLLTEGDEAYQQAEQALAEETDGSSYGFAALDIHLEDADGNEVEPNGDVFVSIDAIGLLPDDADPDSVTVQHHAEAADEAAGTAVTVETVADTADETDGVVEVTPAAEATESTTTLEAPEGETATEIQAAFTVDGFSTFTITYTYHWAGQTETITVNVHYVDTNYHEIYAGANVPTTISANDGNWIDLSQYNYTIEGFAYSQTRLMNANGDYVTARWLRYNDGWRYSNSQPSGNGSRWKGVPVYSNGERTGTNYDIYIVYNRTADPVSKLTTAETVDSTAEGVHMYMFNYDAAAYDSNIGRYGNGDTKQGLASSTVDPVTGWPTRLAGSYESNNTTVTVPEASFSDYFGGTTSAYALSGENVTLNNNGQEVNYLFIKENFDTNGEFYFNSAEYFATLKNDNDNNFTVYNQLGTPSSEGYYFYQRGNFMPYNTLNLSSILNYNLYDDTGVALDQTDARVNEPIYGFNETTYNSNGQVVQANDYYFGMYVWADFYQPQDGKVEDNDGEGSSPMRFEFTGDDDMWVYIDGVLVLDLGGIHDAQSGYIDFSTGEVGYTDTTRGNTPAWNYTTLKDQFDAARVSEDWDDTSYVNGEGVQTTGSTFVDGSYHRIQIFYMERGAGASNLKMSFNLKTIPDGTLRVRKDVENYYAPQLSEIEYAMKVEVYNGTGWVPYANEEYQIYQQAVGDEPLKTDESGQFTIKYNQTAVFSDIDVGTQMRVSEVATSDAPEGSEIRPDYVISYTVTDSTGAQIGSSASTGGDCGSYAMATMPAYGSMNVVVTNTANFTRPLKLVKDFNGTEDGKAPNNFQATYTLYEVTTNGEDVTETPVGSVKYSDLENGSYIFWLDTDKTYTIKESFGDGDNNGGTDELPYSSCTAETNDPVESPASTSETVYVTLETSDATLDSANNPVDTITLTNHYGEAKANLTIVKNIYGLSAEQVVRLVNGDYTDDEDKCKQDHAHGLRFDVDYFGEKEDAIIDNWNGEKDGNKEDKDSYIADRTFDTSETLEDKTVVQEDPFIASNAAWQGQINEDGVDLDNQKGQWAEEAKKYNESSLTYVVPANGGEPYYHYTITIHDVDLNDWYHVMETKADVDNYDLEASVTTTQDGTEIDNLIEDNGGTKTAFQLTGDTTVTFTNRYTHKPVNLKKVDASNTTGLNGAAFYLFKTETGADGSQNKFYYSVSTTGGEAVVTWLPEGKDAENNPVVPQNASKLTSKTDTSGNVGLIDALQQLETGGTYTLTEVTAPNGYQLPSEDFTITIGKDGSIKVIQNGKPLDIVDADGDVVNTGANDFDAATFDWSSVYFLIPNSTGAELPETGGAGTTFLACGGLLLMAAAVGGYALRRRRGKGAR